MARSRKPSYRTDPPKQTEKRRTMEPKLKKELQKILGISRPTVYELLKKKEFRWIQIGTKYRISKKSFDEWLDQKREA